MGYNFCVDKIKCAREMIQKHQISAAALLVEVIVINEASQDFGPFGASVQLAACY